MDTKQNYLNINLKGGRIIKVGGITASLAPLAVAVALLTGAGAASAQVTGVISGITASGNVTSGNVKYGDTVVIACGTTCGTSSATTFGNITTGTISAGNTTTGTLKAGDTTLANTTTGTLSAGNTTTGTLKAGDTTLANTTTGTLNAGNTTTGTLSAGNTTVGTLSAGNTTVANLTANSISTNTLFVGGANITNLQSANVTLANVTAANTTITNSLVVKPGATVDLGGNRLQNVVAGVQDTDGVNIGQLRSVEKMAKQQGAIAAAAVSIPLPSGGTIGETTVGAGLGASGGYAALAVGVSSRIKEDLIIKGTMGISGSTKTIGVGIGYTFK